MPRPKKYNTEEERKNAKKEQAKIAYHKKKALKGKGVVSSINSVFKKIIPSKKTVQNTVRNISTAVIGQKSTAHLENYGNAVVSGRNDYPPKVRQLITKYGDQVITDITICRTPVPSVLTKALSAVSMGAFGKNLANSPYDTLFHLFLRMTMGDGTILSLEKNEVINMDTNPSIPAGTEQKKIPRIPRFTLNELLEKTKNAMGDQFFVYSAKDQNCQDFIIAVLNANAIGDSTDREFVKQNTAELFGENSALRKFANTVTGIGGVANTIIAGAGLNQDLDALLKHLISHITDSKEKMDKRDFTHAKTLINAIEKQRISGKGFGNPPTKLERLHKLAFGYGFKPVDNSQWKSIISDNTSIKPQTIFNDVKRSGTGFNTENDSDEEADSDSDDDDEDDKDYVVQSVVIPSSNYTSAQARRWCKSNGYKCSKMDIEGNTMRFRQMPPAKMKKEGYTIFRNKSMGDTGISLVIVYKDENNISGNGIMPKFAKGSEEAKEHMRKIRAMRGKGMGGAFKMPNIKSKLADLWHKIPEQYHAPVEALGKVALKDLGPKAVAKLDDKIWSKIPEQYHAPIEEIGKVASHDVGFGIVVNQHHHHHHHHMEGGRIPDWLNPKKNGVAKAFDPHQNGVAAAFAPGGSAEQFGREVGHYGIPALTGALGGLAGGVLGGLATGGAGGEFAGGVAGSALGSKAGQAINKAAGLGIGRRRKLKAGQGLY